MADIPNIKDIGNTVKDIGNIFKDLPEIFKTIIELFGLLDDILLLGVKTTNLLLSEIPKFVLMGIDKLKELIPIIVDFVNIVMDILGRYKEVSIILGVLYPVFYLLNIFIDILDII